MIKGVAMRNGFETIIPIGGVMVRIKVSDWKIIFIDEDNHREQRLDVLDNLMNPEQNTEVGTMGVLIADMNTAGIAESGGVINATTLNLPLVKDYKDGLIHPIVDGTVSIKSMSVDDAQRIQTVQGLMYNNLSSLAKYERFTLDGGVSFTPWLKVD